MKYVLLLLLLPCIACAQNINPVYEINRYTVPGKESVTEAKTSTLHAKAEAAAILCKCKVPFRTQGYYDGSVLKVSSSSSVASSSYAQSSSSISSSQSSSVALVPITLSWSCPPTTVTGQPIGYLDIDYYELDLAGETVNLESTGCKMSYITNAPKEGQTYRVLAVDDLKQKSQYATFE